jgi:hypothetical protein
MMSIVERLKALFSRSEAVQTAHAEDVPDPSDRPRSDQQGYEEVKDDDVIARGTATPVGPTLGAGSAERLREEFESDQEPPPDRTP